MGGGEGEEGRGEGETELGEREGGELGGHQGQEGGRDFLGVAEDNFKSFQSLKKLDSNKPEQ